MQFSEMLVTNRPREIGGQTASNRFAFQRTWALCHLLRIHQSDKDYVLIMEFHDDVIVVDNEDCPTCADFYQVKTKRSGQWTKRELIALKSKGKKILDKKSSEESAEVAAVENLGSILGKLFKHCHVFPGKVRKLCLVSNVPYKIELKSDPKSYDRQKILLEDLSEKELSEIKSAILKELAISDLDDWDKAEFEVCELTITEHEKYGIGALAEYLDKRQPGGKFSVKPLFHTLSAELERRATNEWQPVSFAELCDKKGIRRGDLESYLPFAQNIFDAEISLDELKRQCALEGMPYRDISVIAKSWRRYDMQRVDRTELNVQEFRQWVIEVVVEVSETGKWSSISEFLDECFVKFIVLRGKPRYPFDENYLKGALLYEFKAHEHRQLSQADSKPAEGKS